MKCKHCGAKADDSPVFGVEDHMLTVGDFRRARDDAGSGSAVLDR